MNLPPLVRVALPVPLGQAFTYACAEPRPRPGTRVLVEFGRRKALGVVVDHPEKAPEGVALEKLKPLLEIVDQEPALHDELLSFLVELSRYYIAPIGEVLRLALPTLEREVAQKIETKHGKKLKAVGRLVQHAQPQETLSKALEQLKGQAHEIASYLLEHGETPVRVLAQRWKNARTVLKSLQARGLVELTRAEREYDPYWTEAVEPDPKKELNSDQHKAHIQLVDAIDRRSTTAFLLDGITGSGKTEVYLQAAEHTLSQGRGVLLLVPEIALTPQLAARFRARLGDAIAVLHSGLSETERMTMWRGIRDGSLRVVVGARSALFAPLPNLGLICVDEEHDPSYKQEEGVRYNARDMALLRASRAQAVCILGSATPSLASEWMVRTGRLTRLRLRERAHGSATLPKVEAIDLRRFGAGPTGHSLISLPLHRALEENLKAGGQTILFLNRRGYAPSLVCASCGKIFECPHCSVALTLHRAGRERLECHYCGFHRSAPTKCDKCTGEKLELEGLGTEQVETLLEQAFPNARIGRLDRDVASGAKSEKVIERMRRGELDILVGTQMVTKGHDLPLVTLVGVLNADAALSMPDFRAAERAFHLLVQVAGRAGRAERPGRVLIQTRNVEHPAIAAALEHDSTAFLAQELELRHDALYPPFAHVALVRFDGLDESLVRSEAARVARIAGQASSEAEILGPAQAPLGRLQNRYRYRFMVRAQARGPLRKVLLTALRAPSHRAVRMQIDIDPQSLM